MKASHKTPLSFLKPSDTLYIVAHGVNAKIIGRFSPFLMSAIGH
ncbi:hypothetical protein ECP03019043_3304 [Escherichia coli P0301904.3]|nr:hypothetical protein ECP03019043_3304 [Escherichia coli P0301904.3]